MKAVLYALLQTTLDPLDEGRLRRAFLAAPGFAPADVHTLGADAFGILVRNQPGERAVALQGALRREGIETELVAEALLPRLPATRFVKQMGLGADSLVIHDPLGRQVPVEWRHVTMLAAGRIRGTETARHPSSPGLSGGHRSSLVGQGRLRSTTGKEAGWRSERVETPVIELLLGRAVARFTLETGPASRLFDQTAGERRDLDPDRDFASLVRELARHAPQADRNRGAQRLIDEPPAEVLYPTRHAFEEEMEWLLWRRGSHS